MRGAIVDRHPSLELTAVTARTDAGRRLDHALPAPPRAPASWRTFDADRVAELADAAIVAYPHGAAAPVVEDLRERGLKVVDLSADFRPRPGALRALVPAARGAGAARRGRSTACPSCHREEIAGADLVGGAGLLPDRRDPRALCRCAT